MSMSLRLCLVILELTALPVQGRLHPTVDAKALLENDSKC